mgnify:FL=1
MPPILRDNEGANLPTDREGLEALRIEVVSRYMGVRDDLDYVSDPQTRLLLERTANDLLAQLAQIDPALARLAEIPPPPPPPHP